MEKILKEQKTVLEKAGYLVLKLNGRSIGDISKNYELWTKFPNFIQDKTGLLQDERGLSGWVAIPKNPLGGTTEEPYSLEEWREAIKDATASLGMDGVKAIIPNAATYAEIFNGAKEEIFSSQNNLRGIGGIPTASIDDKGRPVYFGVDLYKKPIYPSEGNHGPHFGSGAIDKFKTVLPVYVLKDSTQSV